jgi:hypothetical protein
LPLCYPGTLHHRPALDHQRPDKANGLLRLPRRDGLLIEDEPTDDDAKGNGNEKHRFDQGHCTAMRQYGSTNRHSQLQETTSTCVLYSMTGT